MRRDRVVVIGAGIGGLAAAAVLAGRGVDVTVVERAATPGGKLRQVEVAGRRIDAGPTVLTMKWVFEAIFAAAGDALDQHLDLAPVGVLARHYWQADQRLDLFADPRRSSEAIGDFAGAAEARGYLAFCSRAQAVFDTLDRPFMNTDDPSLLKLIAGVGVHRPAALWGITPFKTLWRELSSYFRDPRLRQLFGRYATYCGSSPFLCPATLMLITHAERLGVWAVKGGMHRIALALAALARRHGAQFRYGSHISRIDVDGGRVTGVRMPDGTRFDANAVLFNGDANALASGLLGDGVMQAAPAVTRQQRSLSAMTWALVADCGNFPLTRHNVFFAPDSRVEFDDLFARRSMAADPTVYVCAEDREGESEPIAGAERLFCIVNAPAGGDTGPLSSREMERCETATFRALARCGLAPVTSPSARMVTTPSDFNQLFPATGGALYGPVSHGWQSSFRRSGARSRIPGLYLAGGSVHPGPGLPMAALSGHMAASRILADLCFDAPVDAGGYAWWYLDALSDDGRHGLTLIAFVGSVFSPYYALSRRWGAADPEQHCAINVALTGDGGHRWAMTERNRRSMTRTAHQFTVGSSAVRWTGDSLVADIDEVTAPFPSRLKGRISLHPAALTDTIVPLDIDRKHYWSPIAPLARVEVRLQKPHLEWNGFAYLDSNFGYTPLEMAFKHWSWSRTIEKGRTRVMYDVTRLRGDSAALALDFDRHGGATPIDAPPIAPLPRTFWRLPRTTRSDCAGSARVLATWEDGPFYARSLVETAVQGEQLMAVQENLSLERFKRPIVQAMLPFRMPRRGHPLRD